MRLPVSGEPALTEPLEFFSPRTLTLMARSRSDSGLMVCMSTVPDRPWPTRLAIGVL